MLPAATDPCAETDDLCRRVQDLTGNDWLAGAANWLIAKPVAILVLLVVGIVLRWALFKVIDRVVRGAATGMVPERLTEGRLARPRDHVAATAMAARRVQRARTVGSVLKSIASFIVFTVVAIMCVAELGYDIGPLIAGAGIVGVALGFGAQNLVRDFLSGIFLAFEDQLGVGDVVEVNDVVGTVEALTLRVTRLRAEDGTVWYVRNGEILKVGNHSQGGNDPFAAAPTATPAEQEEPPGTP